MILQVLFSTIASSWSAFWGVQPWRKTNPVSKAGEPVVSCLFLIVLVVVEGDWKVLRTEVRVERKEEEEEEEGVVLF
jgi:hypothetical protein